MRLGYTLDACMTADAMYEADMAEASAIMLAVINGRMPAPERLRWGRDAGGWGKRSEESERRMNQLAAVERAIEGRRTGGDACQRCGARPGACDHPPVHGGRLVCL